MADLPPAPDDASVTDAPKKKSRLFLLLPMLALALGGAAGGFQYYRLNASPPAAEAPIEYGQFTQLPGIIVNPSDSAGRRYLMVDLGLESAKAKTLDEVTEREIVIRDAVVRILSEHTVEELASIAGREALKDTLRATVNRILEGDIDRLYFTQYVLQ